MSHYFTYSPLTPNTVARAADVNSRFNGVETAFELLPEPVLLSEDRITYSADSGVANAYVATPSVPILAYNAGLRIRLKATNANTMASTVNVSGLGVKQIVRSDGSPLQSADIVAGQILDLTYDGTNFRLAMAFANMSTAGIIAKLATDAASARAALALGSAALSSSAAFQPIDADLTAIAALATTAFGRSLLTPADAAAARTLLGLDTTTSGTYVPTLTNTTNVAVSFAGPFRWMRVGNVVTVSGRLEIDPTAAAAIVLGISLPIASGLAPDDDLSGVACTESNSNAGAIASDGPNDRAKLMAVAASASNAAWQCHFTYEVN